MAHFQSFLYVYVVMLFQRFFFSSKRWHRLEFPSCSRKNVLSPSDPSSTVLGNPPYVHVCSSLLAGKRHLRSAGSETHRVLLPSWTPMGCYFMPRRCLAYLHTQQTTAETIQTHSGNVFILQNACSK